MTRLFVLFIANFVAIFCLQAQDKYGEIKSIPKFSKDNEAAGYYVASSSQYVIMQQDGREIHRILLDSNFQEITSYSFRSDKISFNRKHVNTPVFVADIQIGNSFYEVYSDKNTIVVVQLDFENKKDSILYSLQLSSFVQVERRLAVMPFSKGVRVLSFSEKKNILTVYKWEKGLGRDSVEILLPKSSLSEAEIKTYTKDARIKYKYAYMNMFVNQADKESVIGNTGTNGIFFTDKKVWLLSQTSFFTGYNIIEIDLGTNQLMNANIMINDMRKNNTASFDNVMKPYAAVINNKLIIRNTSHHYFEYHIYDIETKNKVKEYIVETDASFRKVIHSDLNQKGTWFAATDEKKLSNEKAFLRKLGSGPGFISLSQNTKDSITITTGSLIPTTGMAGLLLSIGTGVLGYMANITIGNFQIIPYLEAYRNKLVFCHSKFSRSTLEPTLSNQVVTYLDALINNFDRRDLRSASSFILNRNGQLSIAVFNRDTKKFDVYKLLNE